MPEAKRNKVVSLTQVKGKTHDHKDYIVEKARSFMKRFKSVYVLTYENMTTNNFKALKEELSDCKFLMGKNRVLGVAFGTDEENSFMPNSFRISPILKGHCTLFFTNKKQK
jgi:ribosomal protein L10